MIQLSPQYMTSPENIIKPLRYFLYFLFLPFWWLQKLIPRDKNIWVFGGWYGKKYSDNAKVLFEYIIKHHPEIYPVWLTKRPEIVRKLKAENKNCVLAFSIKGIIYSINAGYVIFSSGKQDVNPFFINGAITINTWHGAPMKKIGLDDKYASGLFKNKIIPVLFPFLYEYKLDYVVSTSEIFNEKLSSAFHVSIKKIICSGYPRNDLFFSESIHELISEWNNKFNSPEKIFYLPTFRADNAFFNPFGYDFREKDWQQFLKEKNAILISKGHFADSSLNEGLNFDRLIQLSDKDVEDLNLLIKDADILITDYSGVYFDFLITNKPIIFAPFDMDDYVSKSRELYFNYTNIISGPVCMNWEEIRVAVSKYHHQDAYIKLRKEKASLFNKYSDGNSSERLSDYICSIISN